MAAVDGYAELLSRFAEYGPHSQERRAFLDERARRYRRRARISAARGLRNAIGAITDDYSVNVWAAGRAAAYLDEATHLSAGLLEKIGDAAVDLMLALKTSQVVRRPDAEAYNKRGSGPQT